MKTAGMITFHVATSLGANLQTYALQQTVNKFQVNCEIINYNRYYCEQEKQIYKKSLRQRLKSGAIKLAVTVNSIVERKETEQKAVMKFRTNFLKISPKTYNTIEELKANPPQYDYYITGSDQVWNPTTTFLEAYYLTFVPERRTTIAYAPSIGVSSIPEKYKPVMKEYISHVQHLSCRERIGAQQISKLMNKPVVNVLDPTFLLTPDDYEKIVIEPRVEEPYLLCYFLGSMSYGRKIAKKIAGKLGLKIVIIPSNPADLLFFHRKIKGVGPREFLGLIKNASFVCTDSFHGLALSVNFNKPFLAFTRRNAKGEFSNVSRLESITELLKIPERLLSPGDSFDERLLNINYSDINPLLSEQREISLNYLKNALNSDLVLS